MAIKNTALQKFHFSVVDENNNPITSGLRVHIFIAGSTVATVYADVYETSLTNPITDTVFATNLGEIEFWYGGGAVDVLISDGLGRMRRIDGLTSSQNLVVFDSREAIGGIMGSVTATELVDSAGSFVEYVEQVTFDGSMLRSGDHIIIKGQILAADFHGEEELDIKLNITDGTNELLLAHTADVVIAANDDYIDFEVDITIITAGSSGKARWHSRIETNLNNTRSLLSGTVSDGMSSAGSTFAPTTDVTVFFEGDYKDAHADQESYAYLSVKIERGVEIST